MVTYFTDPFTGTSGSWSATNWAVARNTTAAAATLSANRGHMNAGTATGYSGAICMKRNGTSVADMEVSGVVNFGATAVDGNLEIWERGDASASAGTGYFLHIDRNGNPFIGKAVSFTYTQLGTITQAINASTDYSFKFYVVGTSIKAKVWPTAGSEPGSYQLNVTDSAVGAAGLAYLACNGGNAASYQIDVDDVVMTDGTGNSFTFTGSAAPSGVVIKNMTKFYTGSITPTGVLNKIKVVTRLFTGSLTPTGAFLKTVSKVFTGSTTPVGVKRSVVPKVFTASTTPTGFFRKSPIRIFTGSITMVGTVTTTFLGRVFGQPGVAAMIVKASGEAIARVRRT